MCGPAIAIIGSLAGAAVSAAGAQQQADAQSRAERIQAMQAQQQAELQNRQATLEQTQGQAEEMKRRTKAQQLSGQQMASIGGSGFTTGGSATDVIIDSRREAELDAAAVRWSSGIKSENQLYGSAVSQWNRDRHYEAADEKQKAGQLGAIAPFIGVFSKLGGSAFGGGGGDGTGGLY